ncbi:MAG TPA: hypothetical protein VGN86_06605 [Pyrinomonadaceae bacterium]|jgi:hypothetical protein|nr:hypothetical protein [Pyrinomonadaceae bacterium]
MESTRKYFLSTGLLSVALIALIAGAVGVFTTTAKAQANRSWTAAGSTGTIDDDSLAIAQFKNFAVTLQPGVNGTARVRYNITAVDGMNQFCPATTSTIKTRFRNSDNNGNTARVRYDLKVTNVLSGGSTILYSFDSNTIGAGTAFTTATATPAIDFDFSQNVYWIDATLFRSVSSEFADIGSIQIWESAGTSCP